MKWRIWKIESAWSNIDPIYVSTMNYPIVQSLRIISNLTLELDSKIEYTIIWHRVNCSRKRKYDVSEKMRVLDQILILYMYQIWITQLFDPFVLFKKN